MKTNTKSSITLPPEELRLVVSLQARLKAKSKVEVVRRGLRLLQETTDRERMREGSGGDRSIWPISARAGAASRERFDRCL
jgi:Arc/MetJ-type ribon-helix-helix transcriptional regulator